MPLSETIGVMYEGLPISGYVWFNIKGAGNSGGCWDGVR
mgnify:CR=1 FL=1